MAQALPLVQDVATVPVKRCTHPGCFRLKLHNRSVCFEHTGSMFDDAAEAPDQNATIPTPIPPSGTVERVDLTTLLNAPGVCRKCGGKTAGPSIALCRTCKDGVPLSFVASTRTTKVEPNQKQIEHAAKTRAKAHEVYKTQGMTGLAAIGRVITKPGVLVNGAMLHDPHFTAIVDGVTCHMHDPEWEAALAKAREDEQKALRVAKAQAKKAEEEAKLQADANRKKAEAERKSEQKKDEARTAKANKNGQSGNKGKGEKKDGKGSKKGH